ncbi:hypothetical protein DL770_000680 [Monosporascus sp. CRB-9-2]|nr:hypothetical protein DL770_000680 [Monosporascus sp. CRB-9-2]
MKSFTSIAFALAMAASLVAASPTPKVDTFAVLDLAPRNTTTVEERKVDPAAEVVKRNATALDKRLEGIHDDA